MTDISLPELVVLVVEPSQIQRRIVRDALHASGIRVVLESENGGDALQCVLGDSPDLVISSFYLPDMTATELISELRASSRHADTPFVLVSSETRFRYLDPIRQAGVAGILPKPFSNKQLLTALTATLDLLSDDSDEEIADRGLRVLVVDDSSMARKHITRVLQTMGIEDIDHAEDGLEALEHIHARLYDFVITDYNMPRMDGKEMIDQIRANSTHASLPVMMVTSEDNGNRIAAVQQSGVSAICDKPFEPSVVRSLVYQIIDH